MTVNIFKESTRRIDFRGIKKMRIPSACIRNEHGYVVIDDANEKAYRVLSEDSYDIVTSKIFREKEGTFWPKIIQNNAFINYGPLKNDENFKTVEVEYLNHVIYWPEMSFFDMKKSLLFLCDVSEFLHENDYHMVSHLWNVVLRNGKPILIDLGDFKKGKNVNMLFETVTSTLIDKTDHHIPRNFNAKDWISNYSDIEKVIREIKGEITQNSIGEKESLRKLRNAIDQIAILETNNIWDEYQVQQHSPSSLKGLVQHAEANRPNLCNIIKEMSPSTMLDLGCSYGLYSMYAASLGCVTTGLDYSHVMISHANEKASALNLTCQFGFIDLLNVKSWGLNGVYGNFTTRLRSDGVIAPALIHLVHGRGKSLERIISEWSSCSKKWIVIEHIPNDTLGNAIDQNEIIDILKNENFKSIQVLDSKPFPRKWIFAKR